MEYTSNDLFYDMSVFNDRMDSINKDNDEEIIRFLMKL